MTVQRDLDVVGALAAGGEGRARSPVARRLRHQALDLAAGEGLARGVFAFRFAPIERVADSVLWVEGEALAAPRLIPDSGTLTALACGICTLGERLEARVRALFAEGRRSLAMALDSLGNEALVALSNRMHHRMLAEAKRAGLTLAGELRSGDPGLALDSQTLVVRLGGGAEIGVAVSSGAMLHPVKSLSAVYGIGLDLPVASWSRCDGCKSAPRCGFVAQSQALH
jgi:hypothetical protein